MPRRKNAWSVPVRITILAHDQNDAVKVANEAIVDGLIEPGFIEDGAVDDGEIFELETAEGEN